MALLLPTDLGDSYFSQSSYDDYRWIFAFSIIFAFLAAYGIGANDVANAFGTSVGSKAITMRQAILIAAVCEFCGAFFLGAQVTNTISGGIAKAFKFVREPELFMYGMLCVDISVAFWLLLATTLELPVSTTHSAVGAVIGMALVLGGGDAVYWSTKIDDFPYLSGVSAIVISWVTSPLLAGIAAAILFFLVRTFVLRHANSFQRSFYALPLIVGLAVAINLMLLIRKGAKNQGGEDVPVRTEQLAAWLSGLGVGLVILACTPLIRKRVLSHQAEATEGAEVAHSPEKEGDVKAEVDPEAGSPPTSFFTKFRKATFDRDVHAEVAENQGVKDLHANAEVFDPRTEGTFRYLQVFTACCNSLAHGANDVANAIGPLAAVTQIYKTSTFSTKSTVPRWILAVGGLGIVVGLSTYGYHIIRVLGMKTIKITSTRGFAIELGAAAVVITASVYGLPVSTTHCLVGATVGVGTLEGIKGVRWGIFGKMILGWMATLVVAGGLCAILVALGAYAPSQQMAEKIRHYEDSIRMRSEAYQYAYQWQASAAATAGAVTPPVLNSTGYFSPEVPDLPASGVPADRSYIQWNKELWKDAGVWSKPASWDKVWQNSIGVVAQDFKGANTSTLAVDGVFNAFDRVQAFAFSAGQQEVISSILRGDKYLCCEEQYKCCPRQCEYEKVDENCVLKCDLVPSDPECVEETCSEDDMESKSSSAKTCTLVDTEDDCPVDMSIDSDKNYVGPNYKSNPITAAPPAGNLTYGASYTDWREAEYDLSVLVCPVALS